MRDEIRVALLVMTLIAVVGALGNLLLVKTDRNKRTILATAFLLLAGGMYSLAQGWPAIFSYGLMGLVLVFLFIDFALRSSQRKDLK